jgi:hypothetical protein
VTHTKGLGKFSAGKLKDFIGENIRLDPVNLTTSTAATNCSPSS